MEVIAIGAGSAGLLLGQGLKQHGIKCTIYEREDSTSYQTRPREWGMTLHWGDAYLSKCIPPDLYARLNDGICSDPFTKEGMSVINYNGATGDKLFEMRGVHPRRVSRRKMRNFLSQGLDIQYGKKIASITHDPSAPPDSQIKATFEDGTTAKGSILIGCDGSKSTVRTLLVGAEASVPEDLDNNMFNITCKFPAATARLARKGHRGTFVGVHPQGTVWMTAVQDIPLDTPDDPSTWKFQHVFTWLGYPRPADLPTPKDRLAFWREQASRYEEPWRTFAREFPDDLPLGVDRITAWRPDKDWSSAFGGLVSMAGDAAHTMPPHRAQGLNNALQDAATIVDELIAVKNGEKGVPEALRSYEKVMKDRVLEEIPVSIKTMILNHKFDKLMEADVVRIGMEKYRAEIRERGVDVEKAA